MTRKKSAMPIKLVLLLLLALGTSLAGCGQIVDDATSSVTSGLHSVTDTVTSTTDTVTSMLHTYSLVSVRVTDNFAEPESSLVRQQRFVYYSPLDSYGKWVYVNGNFITTHESPVVKQLAPFLTPVSVSLDPADQASLNTTLASLSSLKPSDTTGRVVDYWLTTMSGSSAWAVTTYDFANGTSERHFLDVSSGATFEMNGTAIVPGVPVPPSINHLDFGFSDAKVFADAIAFAWASDAYAFVATTVEYSELFSEMPFAPQFRYSPHETIIFPPDMSPGDGAGSVWGFLYYSPTTKMILPVYVYSGILAIPSDAYPAEWDYAEARLDEAAMDSKTAATHIPTSLAGQPVGRYFIDVAVWEMEIAGKVVIVYADGTTTVGSDSPNEW